MEIVSSRPNRRNGRRWNVMWPAVLVVEGKGYACTIIDVSHSGARLDVYGLHFEPKKATLQCERFGSLESRLQWVRGGQAGIRFELTGAEVVDILKTVVPGMGRRDMPARARRATFGRLRLPVAA